MIEQKIQELIEALNANTAALTGTASKTKKAAKSETTTTAEKIVTPPAAVVAQVEAEVASEPVKTAQAPVKTYEPVEIPTVSLSAMREVCQQILDKGAKDKLREINMKHNIQRATESIGTIKAGAVFADLKSLAESL